MPYDLFISYSRPDNEQGRITQLVERIKTDFAPFAKRELLPFFDQQEIHGMQDWKQRILQGLRESRLLLACVSPVYLQSEYCEWEFVEYLKYEIGHLHGFNGVAPIYFVEVPGWDSKDFEQQCAAWVTELRRRQHFDLRPWHDLGEAALREAAVQERMGKLNRQIVQTITRGERADKSLGNVDAHNPHFIGRTANLRMLRENFVTPGLIGVVTAVNGIGGLGKSALAIEYAHAFADEYGGGRWQVRCAGKDDLRPALAELATPIGFEFSDDEKKNADLQFERTRRELKQLADGRAPHRCLLLLDNVDRPGLLDPAHVARLNGGDWLHVLATTRLGEAELHGGHRDRSFLAIDELPADDALALIESYQPDGRFRNEAERDAACEIVRVLGSFTLAVESAAVYLGQFANDVTCAAFLARLKKEGLEGLDTAASQSSEGVLHGEKRLTATLQPTLERLGAAEKLTLEFAALLAPDQVPLPWLRALVAKPFPEMARDAEPGYPDPWKTVLRGLFSLRLFQATDAADADGQPCVARIHGLVQALVWSGLPEGSGQSISKLVQEHAFARIEALGSTKRWNGLRWEIEALDALAELWAAIQHPGAAALSFQVGSAWQSTAEWLRAEKALRLSLQIFEAVLGSNHVMVGTVLNSLAVLLRTTGTFSELEAMYRRVNEIFRPLHEGKDAKYVSALNNLAVFLKKSGRLEEAEEIYREAVSVAEEMWGKDDPQLFTFLNNLAELLRVRNKLKEGEALSRRALQICENAHGPSDWRVAGILSTLASFAQKAGRMDQAEGLCRRALLIDQASIGVEHPNFGLRLQNLADIVNSLGRTAEAEVFYRQSLAIIEASFQGSHPLVGDVLSGLAGNLMKSGNLPEAETLLKRAIAIHETRLGVNHTSVSRDLNMLVSLLRKTNRSVDAEPLMRRALTIAESALGPNHPTVALRLTNLGSLLQALGELLEAEALRKRGLEIFVKDTICRGHENPELLEATDQYFGLLLDIGTSLENALGRLREIFASLNAEQLLPDILSRLMRQVR